MEIQSSLSEIFLSPRGGILSHEEYINHYMKGKVKFNDKYNERHWTEGNKYIWQLWQKNRATWEIHVTPSTKALVIDWMADWVTRQGNDRTCVWKKYFWLSTFDLGDRIIISDGVEIDLISFSSILCEDGSQYITTYSITPLPYQDPKGLISDKEKL